MGSSREWLGRVKAGKGLNRPRGQRAETASTPGAQVRHERVEVCPACGELYEEEGATDIAWVASCRHLHEWDMKTGQLTGLSKPAAHREDDDEEFRGNDGDDE